MSVVRRAHRLTRQVVRPDQVEGRKTAVTPQTLTGEDRATAWERITRERPNTDRVIPVVRLSAR